MTFTETSALDSTNVELAFTNILTGKCIGILCHSCWAIVFEVLGLPPGFKPGPEQILSLSGVIIATIRVLKMP